MTIGLSQIVRVQGLTRVTSSGATATEQPATTFSMDW